MKSNLRNALKILIFHSGFNLLGGGGVGGNPLEVSLSKGTTQYPSPLVVFEIQVCPSLDKMCE